MTRMGFASSKWIQLIISCVKFVSFSILVNGVPKTIFYPSRGIRQGDYLSSYIFIIYAEALSCILNRAISEGSLYSVSFGRHSLSINYLFFADESPIFCKVNSLEWSRLLFYWKNMNMLLVKSLIRKKHLFSLAKIYLRRSRITSLTLLV